MTATPGRDRALGALYGLAIGDALGMPTQDLPRRRAREILSALNFVDAPDDQLISSHTAAGTVTDDTEQALVVARLLVEGGGHLDAHALASRLLTWEAKVAARGSLDLLGPSTRAALAAIAAGADPTTTGRAGATNGAAMRITPVGVAVAPEPIEDLVDAVVAADRPTHDTTIAHSGAAAVAAMVSCGVAGSGLEDAFAVALSASRLAAARGHWVAGPDVASRIEWSMALATRTRDERGSTAAVDRIESLVGTSMLTQESVPAAFAIVALFADDPWRATGEAASLGGDSDTIAAMVGAMLGAVHGLQAWPADAVEKVRSVNALDLESLAAQLLDLRERTCSPEDRRR
ncbi:MAG: ADP-ribosylglycohydrolase family protein [Actinomycetes bacterium]